LSINLSLNAEIFINLPKSNNNLQIPVNDNLIFMMAAGNSSKVSAQVFISTQVPKPNRYHACIRWSRL
jgi:hypothetical protein